MTRRNWLLSGGRPPPAPKPANDNPNDDALDHEQTWKVLNLVTDWLKHAETKAATTLAAAGVSGGVLYNLVKNQTDADCFLALSAITCFVFLILAGLLAGWSLKPRLWASEDPTSPLYFHHIARAHPKSSGTKKYREAVRQLATDRDHLLDEVADQIWNNAHVATQKYHYANLALASLLIALLALAAVATALAIESL